MPRQTGSWVRSSVIKTMGVVVLSGFVLQGCSFGGDDASPSPTAVVSVPGEAAETTKPNTDVMELEPGESMTFDQLRTRAEATVDEYTWPPKFTPDLQTQLAGFPQEFKEGGFEQGFEYAMLSGTNGCAWTLAWVDSRRSGDPVAEAEALDAMTNLLPNNPGVASSPSTLQWLTDMAAEASLGDPTMVNQYVSANCDGLTWKSTT